MIYKDWKGFDLSGKWFKGNLHSHTTNSDGHLRPEESVALYKKHGYHFLCLSEHDTYTDYRAAFNTEDFVILPGLEASCILADPVRQKAYKVHHIHGILGTEKMQAAAKLPIPGHLERLEPAVYFEKWDGAKAAQILTDSLRDRGMFCIYNHPVWSRTEAEEFIYTEGIEALEIYNYNTVNECGLGFDETHWDLMLRKGIHINATASDDNHNEGFFDDACGAWVYVNAPELSHDAIVGAFLAGNYYSSSGPAIYDFGIRADTAYVNCSGCERVNFIAGGMIGDGLTVVADKPDLTYAEYRLNGSETYIRIECVNHLGRKAWTNPIYLETD